MKLRLLTSLLLALLGLGLENHANAYSYQPRFIWVDDFGNVIKIPFEFEMTRRWLDLDEFGFQTPYIDMVITLSNKYEFKELSDVKNGKLLNEKKIRILLNQEISSFVLMIKDPKGDEHRIGLAVQFDISIPESFVHDSCKRLGVTLEPRKLRKTHLHSSISCQKNAGETEIFVVQSQGPKSTIQKMLREDGSTVDSTFFSKRVVLENEILGEKIFSFVISRIDEDESQFDIVRVEPMPDLTPKTTASEPKKPSRWSISTGLGFTYLNYTESPLLAGDIDLTEIVLTGKASISYLLSDRWSLGVASFGNFVPLSQDPSSVSSALFFGFNGRIGYKLPFSTEANQYFVNLGWYLWAMTVSDASYGLDLLSGPQLLLSAKFNSTSHHPFHTYIKIAPIFANQQFGLSNRELAFGGGYRITNNLFGNIALDLTLDITLFGITIVDPQREIQLKSYSLGVSIEF